MAIIATGLLRTLPPHLRRAACIPFEDDLLREHWSYLPRLHLGAQLGMMTQMSRKAAMRLLATALSPEGFAKAIAVMAMEEVLDRAENWHKGRHLGAYWVAVYGEPGREPWGWSFEGHHLSVNIAVTRHGIRTTPLFFGSHPASAGRVLEPMADEDRVGTAVITALADTELVDAVLPGGPPPDIHSGNAAHFPPRTLPGGLAWADMSEQSRTAVTAAVTHYDRLLDPTVLAHRAPEQQPRMAGTVFSWQGTQGGPRYYRLEGDGFLIEYNRTVGTMEHVHCVRRTPGADF